MNMSPFLADEKYYEKSEIFISHIAEEKAVASLEHGCPNGPQATRRLRDTFVKAYDVDSPWRSWGGCLHDYADRWPQQRDDFAAYVHPTPESLERAFERLENLKFKDAEPREESRTSWAQFRAYRRLREYLEIMVND